MEHNHSLPPADCFLNRRNHSPAVVTPIIPNEATMVMVPATATIGPAE
jgi:hypothetical protein